jgi:glycosyltransferase involved in cell wall biosynthesis
MGVDLEAYSQLPVPEQARKELGLNPGITAGYTGHLYPGRGVELLFDLAQRCPEINYLWIGGEPEAVARWKGIMDDSGVGNIQILGYVENQKVPGFQAACDLLLMPYQKSISVSSGGDTAQFASPMKVFEYLATGRAILSSDLPVLREVLSEKNAVLLPAEDTDAWVRALRQLVEDPERRELLAQQGREDASRYTWTHRAKKSLENLTI